MNYFQPMSHLHMVQEPRFHPAQGLVNVNAPQNRYIYVKQNFLPPNPAPVPAPKVLVNPHFKKTVYVNPQFTPAAKPKIHVNPVAAKPKIHVNPNVLKNFASNVPKVAAKPVTDTKSTVISTKNKFIRIPCNSMDKVVRKRRNSLHTKYKIVKSTSVRNSPVNKFKLDKRVDKSANTSLRSIKKKYVYVNRFLSINVMAKSVLLKNANLTKPGFVNINGILYKKSPNSLKKAADSSLLKFSKPSSRYKVVRKDMKQTVTSSVNKTNRRSLVKRYKLIRSGASPKMVGKVRLCPSFRSKKQTPKVSPSKLRKCNMPCPVYRKFGKCKGKESGKCFKLHNPDQIILCTRFLQGACLNENCLLSHKVSHEKMPTCKYFLEGLCSKDNCPYLHVKISPKAEICRDFLEGFCKNGGQCEKRHQFLCPDFEKNKQCPKRRCPYPHGNSVRQNKITNTLAKKCSVKKEKPRKVVKVQKLLAVEAHNRYYKECDSDKGPPKGNPGVIKTVSKDRPKLGDLPAFIPLFEAT